MDSLKIYLDATKTYEARQAAGWELYEADPERWREASEFILDRVYLDGERRLIDGATRAWGLSCPLGWSALVEETFMMFGMIDSGWELHQLKEKFGTLTIYVGGGSRPETALAGDAIRAVNGWASEQSARICAECGRPGRLRNDMSWVLPLCCDHYLTSGGRLSSGMAELEMLGFRGIDIAGRVSRSLQDTFRRDLEMLGKVREDMLPQTQKRALSTLERLHALGLAPGVDEKAIEEAVAERDDGQETKKAESKSDQDT